MRSPIRRRLLRLIVVPLSGLVLVLAIFAIFEFAASTTQKWLRHSAIVIQLSQHNALTLARRDVEMVRGDDPAFASSSTREIAANFTTLRALVVDDPAQEKRLDAYAVAARDHLTRPGDSAIAVRLDRAQRAFDDVETAKQRRRRIDFDRVRQWLFWALALGAAVVIVSTVILYRTLALDIARRLAALSINTQRLATGQPVPPPDTSNDEIGDVDARFRLVFDLLADREATAARYRILAEQTSDIMLFIDGVQIVEANEAAAKAYGYSREELRALSVYDLRVPELHDELRAILERPLDQSVTYETMHRRRDGTQFAVEVAMRQASIEGRQITCVVARDVTSRHEAESRLRAAVLAANEASRLKSEFVATMSHEIRTPMNAVLGMTELLLSTSLDPEQYELARTAHDSGSSLLRIIDDILDFSKIEAGRLEVEMRAFRLRTCVESVAQLLASQTQRKGIAFTAFVPPELPDLVIGDDLRIRQILTNLIGNAIKFTSAGSISLVTSIVAQDTTTLSVRFEVSDTGIGIEPRAATKLFTPFSQADGSITRRYGGTGLGLTISKRLVELMGGTIGVTSKPHIGSTFWFELPLHIAEDQPDRVTVGSYRRVIVADVSRTAIAITARYLRAWGIDVDEVGTQDELERRCAEARLQGRPYALAFVDASVALDDRKMLLAKIARASRGTLPAVLTSTFDLQDATRDALRDGFRSLLVKPIKASILYDCMMTFADGDRQAATDDAPSEHAPSIARPTPVTDPPSAGKALLVEDNPVNQRVARKQLEKLGYDVTCAENGRVAVEAVAREGFAIVFMDLQMPEMDGITATRTIRRSERGTGRHVPIVALTADVSNTDRTECLESGMDDFLAKPLSLSDLKAALARWTEVPA